jgi:deoxyxylulose-5-phosphate synthase
MTIYYRKEELTAMLEASQHDFEMWETSAKQAYLKDAANKLVALAENITANKIKKDIRNWGEFKSAFLREFNKPEMLSDLYILHRFFYEGLGYDETEKDIEYTYHKVKKFFRNLVEKTEYEKRVKV